jgi:ABC-type glycerol-3-phosphate transport system substrate-binding protein
LLWFRPASGVRRRKGAISRRLTLLLAAALALAAASAGGASISYIDSSGDSGSAPDITTTEVSNDDAGTITLTITIANQPSFSSDAYFDMGR